jgi:hypothetical protein
MQNRFSLWALLSATTTAFIVSCGTLPSGYDSSYPGNAARVDGGLSWPQDYRQWRKFVPTVDREDRGEVREIYMNDRGTEGTETHGFPNGTTFVMEIFDARRGSLVLMPNEKITSTRAGQWRVEVYVEPQSSLLPSDTPGSCRWLSVACGWSFEVADRAVDTGIHIPKGASVRVVSSGNIRFVRTSSFSSPDGTDEPAPSNFPASALRRSSLICKVGNSPWVQCGTDKSFTPDGGDQLMRTPAGQLVKGRLQGVYVMQKGPDWGRDSRYETGDWVFDHYRPVTGQHCVEETVGVSQGSLRCLTGFHISQQHEKVAHQDWSRDCRRCHTPTMEEVSAHDRQFIYGYSKLFKAAPNSDVKLYSEVAR